MMRRVCVAVMMLLASVALGQVYDRLGAEDLRWGGEWTRTYSDGSTVTRTGLSPVNVKGYPFLAAGDGVTDDTDAIQAAIDSVESWCGGMVYFPEGIYRTSANIIVDSDNVHIRGAGIGATIVQPVGGVDPAETPFVFRDCSDVSIADLTVRAVVATGGDERAGIAFQGVLNGLIASCEADSCDDRGIQVSHYNTTASQNVTVRDCKITSTTEGSGIEVLIADDVKLLGNYIYDDHVGTSHGIRIAGVNRCIVDGNVLIGATGAASVDGVVVQSGSSGGNYSPSSDVVISDNSVSGQYRFGIRVREDSINITISGNSLTGESHTSTSFGVYTDDRTTEGRFVEKLNVFNNSIAGFEEGVRLRKDISGVTVSGNLISGFDDYGVRITRDAADDTVKNIFVMNNRLKSGHAAYGLSSYHASSPPDSVFFLGNIVELAPGGVFLHPGRDDSTWWFDITSGDTLQSNIFITK